jgi:protease IV
VLVVSPEGALVEQYSGDPISRAIGAAQGLPRSRRSSASWSRRSTRRPDDKRVTRDPPGAGLLAGGSIDKLASVAAALQRFRDSGKPVLASAAGLALPQYYLAAHADEIYMNPLGGMLLQGFGFYRNFYKAALEKLSLDWYVFRAGEAKSFGDPFTRNDMSAEERENLLPIAEACGPRGAATWPRPAGSSRPCWTITSTFPAAPARAGGDDGRVALDAGMVDELLLGRRDRGPPWPTTGRPRPARRLCGCLRRGLPGRSGRHSLACAGRGRPGLRSG